MNEMIRLQGILVRLELFGLWGAAARVRDELDREAKKLKGSIYEWKEKRGHAPETVEDAA